MALGIASEEELDEISRQARAVNDALKDIFSKIDVQLVDFKIEEGKTGDGRILLADEITPGTPAVLWDLKDGSGQIEHLDKDLFRRDLGNIIPPTRRSTTGWSSSPKPRASSAPSDIGACSMT